MKPVQGTWHGRDGDEGGAPDALPERANGLVERLMAKLARHNRDAEQLAEVMHDRRRRS